MQGKIIQLANKGYDLERIAQSLSIPKEEVQLVLDLKSRIARLSGKEGMS